MTETDINTKSVALTIYLEQHISGFCGPVSLKKFPGGQSNPTYLLTAGSGQYVLRSKPPGDLLASAHAVDREYRVLHALRDTAVPVPRVYHLCEDDSVFGAMFYVMGYEEGRIFWDAALPEVAIQDRQAIVEEQVRALATLHNVDPKAVGLGDYGPQANYYLRQISRWSKQYKSAETQQIASMDTLLRWLPENMPADDGCVSLIHGDYRLDNMIFHPTEPRIIAILDWELSTLGHPLADLAYGCMCMRLPEMGSLKGLAGKNRDELGLLDEEQIIALYCKLRNLDHIDHWPFYLAFSYFRLAAICQGVYKRAQMGNASDVRAASRENLAPALSDMAIDVLKRGNEL